ncbi:unnamed protein product [Rotaria sp. Silwood2]|nr:unnamed protein product [Rotaria sp. Silwood2]CAF4040931.1 unnamed protein product [Rotaria sp. Silwood2]CAF4216216.1 unnamed protein product [Rotaria sp. Silwood2]
MTSITNSEQEDKEYNPLSCSKKKYASYPILTKATARVLAVPVISVAVEQELSFTVKIITQKGLKIITRYRECYSF